MLRYGGEIKAACQGILWNQFGLIPGRSNVRSWLFETREVAELESFTPPLVILITP